MRAQSAGSTAINDRIASLSNPMRVLTVAAHPDDEDTGLITWLARGQHVNTAYLSLTRGDGGQNLIGNELGEALGVIRTEELLAARRIDGAHQYFTRAYDFGFSKTADEAFSHWPRFSLLGDVVKVVRTFKPQVIIAFFAGTPRDGHGQHQVSAILARQAYDSAAVDTIQFPIAEYGKPWRVSKYYRTGRQDPQLATLTINVGEYNPVLGESYAEIAAQSRSQHKSQGFGTLKRKGVVKSYLIRVDSRVPAPAGAKMEKSMFDGIDTTPLIVPVDSVSTVRLLANLAVEAVADRQAVAQGENAKVRVTVFNRGKSELVIGGRDSSGREVPRTLAPDSSFGWSVTYARGVLTQPWWLQTPRRDDLFSQSIGPLGSARSEDQRAILETPSINVPVWIGDGNPTMAGMFNANQPGVRLVRSPIVYHYADPVHGDIQRPLMVAPGISLTLDRTVEIARAGVPLDRFIGVTLRSALSDTTPVTVRLNLPAGLIADSAARTGTMALGSTRRVTFHLRGTLPKGSYTLGATASAGGKTYSSGYVPIEYEHITPRTLYRPATMTLNTIDVALPKNLNVAYVPGVGDNVEPMLEEMGVPMTVVQPRDIPTVELGRFTTIVVGPRAYQASQELRDNNSYLLEYVKNGGRLVVQYGQYELMRPGLMPYPITIRNPHDRVTDENAAVTIVDAGSPVLNTPNKITQQDFAGWVQERALYMPIKMDAHYHSIMSMNDPGEPANNNAIIYTTFGKGTYFYVPLALFRQLPAGVSGGARIFANLLGGK
ncbi:MAG: PIG-L family deacetylase [Gemmatimonadaceae bacterium]|nr:PIG-L family deacetylase [Gemmatimonadaceae bacterium]